MALQIRSGQIGDLTLSKITDVTSTAAELNILTGVTASTAELNHVSGVTSSIQTQLGGKANLTGAAFTGAVSTGTGINLSVGGDLSVTGNLTVNGSTTTVNSTTVQIDDPVFTLGGNEAPTADDDKDRGIEFRWHNGTDAKIGFFGYDDSNGVFTFIKEASNTNEVFGGTPGTALFGALTFNGDEVITTVVDSAKTPSSYDNDASIPTVATMIDYVPKELNSLSDVSISGIEANGNMFLYDASANAYINVKMVVENHTADATQVITLSDAPASTDFHFMAQVYLNGQKMRLDSTGASFTDGHDYYFSGNGELTFDNVLSSGDNVEVIFYKQQG